MAHLIKQLCAMSLLDGYMIEDALDSLELTLRDASPCECKELARTCKSFLSAMEGKSISGESPLVLVDRARALRDKACAKATLSQLDSLSFSRAARRRIDRIAASLIS